MMELKIAEKLRFYRRKAGYTQEEMAAHLGVSFQAISKWERGYGYPDITMLPALAKYFGISVDELIGMNELADKEIYDEINVLWNKNNAAASEEKSDRLHRENVELMQDALKKYPNDPLILVQLSISLRKLHGTNAEKKARLQEAVLLEEQILRGEDSEVRSSTLSNICFSYERLGEHEKAIAAAKRLSNLYKMREAALAMLSKNEERHINALEALPAIAYIVSLQLSAL